MMFGPPPVKLSMTDSRAPFLQTIILRRQMEVFVKSLAQLLIAGKTGSPNDIFNRRIRFAEQQLGSRNAATLNCIQDSGACHRLEFPFQRAAIHSRAERDICHTNLIVTLAPDEI